jgi:hypothetical protein
MASVLRGWQVGGIEKGKPRADVERKRRGIDSKVDVRVHTKGK